MFLPYGRLLRCELVNTVDSTNIDTPIIGLVIEDAWNDGRLIVPAGTEVHGVAQKSPVRERIGSDRQWFLVFQDGRELPISGSVLDYAPKNSDSWAESDGSAGLRGFVVKSDKYAEAKAILAAMISAGAGAFPETTTLISPLGGATQLNNGGIDSAFSAGLQAGGQLHSTRLLERLDKDPFYVRVPAGTTFYLYVTQTVDLGKATIGLSASDPTAKQPDSHTSMKSCHAIILLSIFAGCATRKEVRSLRPLEVPGATVSAEETPEICTPEIVKAYPVGRYTDPNFPEEMHERHPIPTFDRGANDSSGNPCQ